MNKAMLVVTFFGPRVGIIDDDFSYASAVILENELYVCSSLGNQSSSGLYKSSLSNFLDLYVKD